ncbi:WhiB family transcriptional regulator [Streptomyces sp. NPDC059385]|uniref:WhiB family transcriptional regulator n=1 Tax=Streptomyces sp. NPDC059385 TaxID=3346817 RepID=UPI00369CC792
MPRLRSVLPHRAPEVLAGASAWRQSAACAGLLDNTMFPENSDTAGIEIARRFCAMCPVWEECLADAVVEEGGKAKDNRYGIRAGLTPYQRHGLHARNRKPQADA